MMKKKTKYEMLVNHISKVCLSLVGLISLFGLYSRATGQVEFASFGTKSIPMAPSTAMFLIILTIDLALKSKINGNRVARIIEKIVLISISALSIIFVLHLSSSLGIENSLSNNEEMYLGVQLWKMSPLTGICIVLTMLSLEIKLYLSNKEIADKIFTIIQLVTISIAVTIIVGYGYKTPFLYGGTIIPVALPTGICFCLLTIATITSFGNNTRIIKAFNGTTVTSNLVRTIIPITLIILIGMGFIEMICINYNIVSHALLSAISLITNILILNVAIVFASRKIGLIIDIEIKKRKLSEHELLKSNNDLEEINAQLEEEIAVRTKIEDDLKASELQFRRALDEAPIPIMLRADDGEVLKISSKWTEITGYTIQDIPTINDWTTKAYGTDKLGIQGLIKDSYDPSTQTVDGEYKITTAGGKVRIWEFNTANIGKIADGRKVAMTAATDITDRKRTEEALKESESRLIAAQLMAHVGNWELNLDTEKIWASEEAFNIYGIEYISQYLPLDLVQKCVFPEYRESLNISLNGLITKKEKYDKEFKIKNAKTGEERFVHSKAILLFDETGNASKVAGTIQDITERKQAEDALRSNRRQLTDIIEFLPDATLAINKEGQVIIWNKAIAKMTCIPAAEMIGKLDYACTIPFYGEARPHLMDLVFLDDEEIVTRYPNLTREGDTLMAEVFCPALYNNKGAWVFAKASPLHDQSGNIIGAIESIRDITEQKLAEAVLQSKTAFLEAQTNASLDGILVVNQNQTRILTNRRIFELFNVPQNIIDDEDDTLLLKHVVSLTKDPEQFLKRVLYLYDHLNETSCDEIEFKSGMVLDRQSAPVMDKKGKYYGRIWTFHDITDHKRLETALEKEKNLLETTLISVGDGVISTDNKGNIVFLNRVAEFLTGWTQEAARGKSIEEVFDIVNEFTREKSENIVKKALESGKMVELATHTILISKDGMERPIEDSAAPIVQENGETFGVVLVFRDFSEKKQKLKEIEFLSYHDQLTGLYNRRFYEEELKRLDTERNFPLTIVMGDVNGLKLINDSFGHVMGDELLQKVAEVLKRGCRTDDIIARLGGDEFVIILPKTDALETEKIIKRIQDLASKEKVGSIDISISFGYETKNNAEEKIQEIFKKAEDHMYKKKLFESPSMRGKTIKAIIYTLHEKNKREEQHSHRVLAICKSMGEALGLTEYEIEELKSVGLLHDIGKIAIDENVLNKPGKLTDDEWKEIKRHPEIGYRILNTVNDMSDMANYVLYHHERWDGKGYPKGLKGDEIPFVSRIITIADAYDAMTSERSYRSALPEEFVIEELEKNAGLQFDPELVKVFIEKVLGQISV